MDMKKLVLVTALVLGLTAAANAQPRAIGGRLTYGIEASYQHSMQGNNFIEADLGVVDFDGLNIAAFYDFMIAQPAWTSRGTWGFYAGPGAAIKFFNDFSLGVAGQVGLEYTFWFPLQLSVDIRPQIGLVGDDFNIWGWYPAVAARFRF